MTRTELIRIRDAVHEGRDFLDKIRSTLGERDEADSRRIAAFVEMKANRLRWVCGELDRELDRPPELFPAP